MRPRSGAIRRYVYKIVTQRMAILVYNDNMNDTHPLFTPQTTVEAFDGNFNDLPTGSTLYLRVEYMGRMEGKVLLAGGGYANEFNIDDLRKEEALMVEVS